jgi:hypothetical protein
MPNGKNLRLKCTSNKRGSPGKGASDLAEKIIERVFGKNGNENR